MVLFISESNLYLCLSRSDSFTGSSCREGALTGQRSREILSMQGLCDGSAAGLLTSPAWDGTHE